MTHRAVPATSATNGSGPCSSLACWQGRSALISTRMAGPHRAMRPAASRQAMLESLLSLVVVTDSATPLSPGAPPHQPLHARPQSTAQQLRTPPPEWAGCCAIQLWCGWQCAGAAGRGKEAGVALWDALHGTCYGGCSAVAADSVRAMAGITQLTDCTGYGVTLQ